MKTKRTPLQITLFILFILAVIGSAAFSFYKYRSLGFGIDSVLYLQFSAKFLDPKLTSIYTINPRGYNFFGLTGVGGQFNLFTTIHFEPVKISYAIIHFIFRSPLAVYMLFSAIYFTPLLYLGRVFHPKNRAEQLLVLSAALIYVFYPSVLSVTSFDLRPRMLLNAAIPMLALAVVLKRPRREKLWLLAFLLTIREESLLFAFPLIILDYFETPNDPQERSTLPMFWVWLGFLLVEAVYFGLSIRAGYVYDPTRSVVNKALAHPLLLGAGLALLVIYVLLGWWVRKAETNAPSQIAFKTVTYLLVMTPVLMQFQLVIEQWYGNMGKSEQIKLAIKELLYSPQLTIAIALLLALLLMLYHWLRDGRLRTAVIPLVSLGAVASIGLFIQHVPTIYRYVDRPAEFIYSPDQTEIVFALREQTEQHNTSILVDNVALQAFYDYENVHSFERLPYLVVSSDDRYFPANLPYLQDMLTSEPVAYAVVQLSSLEDVQAIFESIEQQVTTLSENERFIVLQVLP